MYRLVLRLLTALITFALSLALTWLLSLVNRPTEQPRIQQRKISYSHGGQRRYESVGAGRGRAADGHGTSFTHYKTSDGMAFSQTIVFYDSPQQAGKKLRERLKGGEVIKRKPVLDETGKTVGQWVIVKYASGGQETGAAVLCANKSSLIITSSTSLENILEYEKDQKRQR